MRFESTTILISNGYIFSAKNNNDSSHFLNLDGHRGTTYGVATIPFHVFCRPQGISRLHSLMLSLHLFFCRPLCLAPFTVPCRIVFAMPEDLEMLPYHLSFCFFTMGSVHVAERLALPTSDHGVAGLKHAGGEILPETKQRFIAQSLLCSPFHHPRMIEILLEGCKTLNSSIHLHHG